MADYAFGQSALRSFDRMAPGAHGEIEVICNIYESPELLGNTK